MKVSSRTEVSIRCDIHTVSNVLLFRRRPGHSNSSISEINDPHFYIEKDEDGNLQLKKSHDYFIQVQAQMTICNKQYCDFVCWTTSSIHIERIEVDPEVMKSILPKLTTFFINYILPELLTNKFQITGKAHDPHSNDAEDDNDDGIFCQKKTKRSFNGSVHH